MTAPRHLQFCPPGTVYFDMPASDVSTEDDFAAVTDALPAGWQRRIGPDWVMLTPPEAVLPMQGWKIHISATPENAERILAVAWRYAADSLVAFKFIRSLAVLLRRNGKYGDRSASGKFVTIYPRDERVLEKILDELGDLLDGEAGPYILSDLRWRSGPLYVRYGGFVSRMARSETGETVPCIEDPDGRLVPDRRGPSFRPPQWVQIPSCLDEALASRNAGTLGDFPFRIDKALHYSNGGGIYQGVDTRTGASVLLREARPLAGLDSQDQDAVARLKREHEVLERLAGLACVPKLIEYRVGFEHHFLAREYVDGQSLAMEVAQRNPLSGDGRAEDLDAYTRWALDVIDQVEQGLRALHDQQVVFGDLHPGNIMVRSDGSVAFIDFETAGTDPQAAQIHAAPGFVAPPGYRGKALDRYALGCLRLALFAPLTTVVPWGPQKVDQLIDLVTEHFPVPGDYGDKVRRDLDRATGADADPALRTAVEVAVAVGTIADGILATATPEREDRLFPGDAAQFFSPEAGAAFAHGAAGVLWSLAEAEADVPAAHVDWLQQAGRRLHDPAPGFYSGLSGIAYALDRLGRTEAALDLLARVDADRHPGLGGNLFDGLAGIGLTHLHFARRTGDPAHREQAVRCAEQIIAAAEAEAEAGRRVRPGLMHGPAGRALLLVHLYEETGDAGYLDAAEQLLHTDLRALGWSAAGDGSAARLWDKGAIGRRPLVAVGSAGTGLVLHRFLGHRADPRLARARDAVRDALRGDLPRSVSLFYGQAGTLLALRQIDPELDPATHSRQLAGLELHAVRHEDRLAFLGHESLRISTDLATGAAGVLLAVTTGSGLPFTTG